MRGVSAEFTPRDEVFFRLAYDRTQDDSSPRHGHREVAGVGPDAGARGKQRFPQPHEALPQLGPEDDEHADEQRGN